MRRFLSIAVAVAGLLAFSGCQVHQLPTSADNGQPAVGSVLVTPALLLSFNSGTYQGIYRLNEPTMTLTKISTHTASAVGGRYDTGGDYYYLYNSGRVYRNGAQVAGTPMNLTDIGCSGSSCWAIKSNEIWRWNGSQMVRIWVGGIGSVTLLKIDAASSSYAYVVALFPQATPWYRLYRVDSNGNFSAPLINTQQYVLNDLAYCSATHIMLVLGQYVPKYLGIYNGSIIEVPSPAISVTRIEGKAQSAHYYTFTNPLGGATTLYTPGGNIVLPAAPLNIGMFPN
ncbi:MAG: hypothetical protein JW795_04315 [Chitinivibrionales bacterium]|nr:hypothetical protein [Chitinivibrionales bacterium]